MEERAMRTVAAVVVVSLLALWPLRSQTAEPFSLEVMATTMTQIVLQWRSPPANTALFELQRATDPAFTQDLKTYPLDKTTLLFSDTNRPPVSRTRFMGDLRGPLLDRNTTYSYRVRAVVEGGGEQFSNVVQARVSEPVRGKEADLWADIVLGKPDFGTNTFYQTTKYGVDHPGGILIDKTVKPNRMYISDCNNNRIIGFKTTSANNGADIVLGQPDFSSSAGNGDSCAQLFPYRGKASAKTLCLTNPEQISMAETVVRVNIAVDDKGNVYVPDIYNNRVLKYNNPFATDTVADEVWGQADFTGNEPNRGGKTAAANSLRFSDRAGVAIDPDGNLWVADSGNNRVLRFAKNKDTGIIAKDADIVLGQPDLESSGEWGVKRTLAQMWCPIDVEFDTKGNLYTCDGQNAGARLLVFEPPFKSGMEATKNIPMPMPEGIEEENRRGVYVGSIARDVDPDRMWIENGQNTAASELLDVRDGKIITSLRCEQGCGIDVDSEGNLYMVGKWDKVIRYPASSFSLPPDQRIKAAEPVLIKSNTPTAASTGGVVGITTFRDQLLICTNTRVLIWNTFNLDKMKSGQPADDIYGEKDFSSISDWERYLYSPQEDKSGRLWLGKRENGHALQCFAYPLTHDSKPLKTVRIGGGNEDVLPVIGGGGIHAVWADFIDFAVVGKGDKIWVADRTASRVFRINNVDGLEDSQSGPYVDIVLGQNSLTDDKVHMGKDSLSPQSLAWPYNVGVSPSGELLISDNGGECGTDGRILIYKPGRFPNKPDKCLFARDIGDPDKVIGTGNRLDIPGDKGQDPICSPFQVGISTMGTVVAPMNSYSQQRFPLVYLYPNRTTEPQIALGDLTSYPITCFIDKDGNVYIGDWDWYRVIVYRKPFEKVRY
jgi:sugar lactone lactonase YvrE